MPKGSFSRIFAGIGNFGSKLGGVAAVLAVLAQLLEVIFSVRGDGGGPKSTDWEGK
jgi:hypothetical protein